MQSRSLARELALLVLGQVPEGEVAEQKLMPLESLLQKALDGLTQHWRDELDSCAEQLEKAQQQLLDCEINDFTSESKPQARENLQSCLTGAERVLNGLSASLELPRLLALADQKQIRLGAMQRIEMVLQRQGRRQQGDITQIDIAHAGANGGDVVRRDAQCGRPHLRGKDDRRRR